LFSTSTGITYKVLIRETDS
jgi:hypothetical protein